MSYFNSRLSARGYEVSSDADPFYAISIHASLREATRNQSRTVYALVISIHASLREATFFVSGKRKQQQISIHASLREAT